MKYILAIILFIIPLKLKDEHILVDSSKDVEIVVTEDIKCLADNIYHESKGESLKGKQGVAQVTMNRVYSKKFPSNVCDVVYERKGNTCQFSWTCRDVNVIHDEHYEDSIIVADAMINNLVRDSKLKNSLFFHADYVNLKWKKKRITKIGKHIFYE